MSIAVNTGSEESGGNIYLEKGGSITASSGEAALSVGACVRGVGNILNKGNKLDCSTFDGNHKLCRVNDKGLPEDVKVTLNSDPFGGMYYYHQACGDLEGQYLWEVMHGDPSLYQYGLGDDLYDYLRTVSENLLSKDFDYGDEVNLQEALTGKGFYGVQDGVSVEYGIPENISEKYDICVLPNEECRCYETGVSREPEPFSQVTNIIMYGDQIYNLCFKPKDGYVPEIRLVSIDWYYQDEEEHKLQDDCTLGECDSETVICGYNPYIANTEISVLAYQLYPDSEDPIGAAIKKEPCDDTFLKLEYD